MHFFLDLPFYGNPSSDEDAYTKLYIKSTTKVKEMVLDYDFLTTVAEIGGYTGLLLGVSVVNITIIFEKLIAKFFKI